MIDRENNRGALSTADPFQEAQAGVFVSSELGMTLPADFQGNVLLDVGHDTDLPDSGSVYDVVVFRPNLDTSDDLTSLLRKVSEVTRFGIITDTSESPATTAVDTVGCHTGRAALRSLIERSGFDVLAESLTDIPRQAGEVTCLPSAGVEPTGQSTVGDQYPVSRGEVYGALLKSRNVRVMSPETAKAVHTALAEEFGAENVVSTAIFGSTTRSTDKVNSDYDYTVLVEGLSPDVYERERACPRIKRSLRDAGISELCAFNLYTPEEFQLANGRQFWLVESMKTGYRVLHDTDDFMRNILDAKHPDVERIDELFAWKGVEFVEASRFEHVIDRHLQAAALLQDADKPLADCHTREAQRVALIARLHEHGEATSRGSLFSLARRLNAAYGEQFDLAKIEQDDFEQEMEGKSASYGYATIDRHLEAAALLEAHGMPLEALSHTVTALRNVYLHALHSNGSYIVDGEVTQLFLREFADRLPDDLVDTIYAYSFKAEQVLGRSGFLSFDLDSAGNPIYEDSETSKFDYAGHAATLRNVIRELRGSLTATLTESEQVSPVVSIVIAAQNEPDQLEKCLASLDRLIIPAGRAEIIIVNDGSEGSHTVNTLQQRTALPIRLLDLEPSTDMRDPRHMGAQLSTAKYVTFLADDAVVSPLWLVNLLSGFKDDNIAGVGAAHRLYPTVKHQGGDAQLPQQPPVKDALGRVVNVMAASACLKRDVLLQVGGLSAQPISASAGLDVTRRIRDAGYTLGHVEGEATYSAPGT